MLTTYLEGDYSKPVPYYEISAKPKTVDHKEVQCTLLMPTQLNSSMLSPPIQIKPSKDDRSDFKHRSQDRYEPIRPVRVAADDAFKKAPKGSDFLFDRMKTSQPQAEANILP
jgi:hypothetical protein